MSWHMVIVVCTHMYLTNVLAKLMMKYDMNFYVSSVIVALFVLLSYYAIVPLAKRIRCLSMFCKK